MMLKEIFKDVESRMQQAVDHLMHELSGVRTGRASLVIFDGVRVDSYGTPSPLNQVAKLQRRQAHSRADSASDL